MMLKTDLKVKILITSTFFDRFRDGLNAKTSIKTTVRSKSNHACVIIKIPNLVQLSQMFNGFPQFWHGKSQKFAKSLFFKVAKEFAKFRRYKQ